MTTAQISKKVKSMIKKDFGKSFSEIKNEVFLTIKKGSSCSDFFDSKNGYILFYTTNDNFQRGKANGGGKGLYARISTVGMKRDIKL